MNKFFKLLMAALLVVAFTAGGGSAYEPKTYGTSIPPGTNNERAQEIVDNDSGITAYKIFTVEVPSPTDGQPMVIAMRLPMLVPKPNKENYSMSGRRLGQKLAALQFRHLENIDLVTFLLTWPDLRALVVSYYIFDGEKLHTFIYDGEGNPQLATQEELKRLLDSYSGEQVNTE